MRRTDRSRLSRRTRPVLTASVVLALVVGVALAGGADTRTGRTTAGTEAEASPTAGGRPTTTTTGGARPARHTVPTNPSLLLRRRRVAGTAPTTTAPAPAPTTTVAGTRAESQAASGGGAPGAPHGTAIVPGGGSARLGVYVGGGDTAGLAAFESATGAQPTIVSDYLPGGDGWAGMSSASSLAWLLDAWHGTGDQLALGVPIIPSGPGGPVTTLAAGATGADDGPFLTLAQTLVSAGDGNAILRLGWEFDGGWYNWAVHDDAEALEFAAYFRQIVTTMRSVPGAAFQFVWNLSGGPTSWPVADAYPGDAYVDYVGEDPYDETWGTPQTPAVAWAGIVGGTQGLDWLADFAAAHGKQVALPEWGLSIRSDGHGLGDDPSFIDQMSTWIAGHDVGWTSYFDADTPGQLDAITDGRFPNALAAFRQDFG